jgi:hypothetical protein
MSLARTSRDGLVERACATCKAKWRGQDGDSCPNCGEARQCRCKHCEAMRRMNVELETK